MGKTTFIVPIGSRLDVINAFCDIANHNRTLMMDTKTKYSDEEFQKLDPKRHAVLEMLKGMNGMEGMGGCDERWTRGEDLSSSVFFVRHGGLLFLETINCGGGACSTVWLREHSKLQW